MVQDKLKTIEKTAGELLANLQVAAAVEVREQEGVYQVVVTTEESGLLIGYHGETLSSLQLMLGLILHRRLGEWVRVVVEVGDYRAKKTESLAALANEYADRVVAQGVPIALAPMPPFERRVVHLALAGRTDVETVSEGDGDRRHVVIKPV